MERNKLGKVVSAGAMNFSLFTYLSMLEEVKCEFKRLLFVQFFTVYVHYPQWLGSLGLNTLFSRYSGLLAVLSSPFRYQLLRNNFPLVHGQTYIFCPLRETGRNENVYIFLDKGVLWKSNELPLLL